MEYLLKKFRNLFLNKKGDPLQPPELERRLNWIATTLVVLLIAALLLPKNNAEFVKATMAFISDASMSSFFKVLASSAGVIRGGLGFALALALATSHKPLIGLVVELITVVPEKFFAAMHWCTRNRGHARKGVIFFGAIGALCIAGSINYDSASVRITKEKNAFYDALAYGARAPEMARWQSALDDLEQTSTITKRVLLDNCFRSFQILVTDFWRDGSPNQQKRLAQEVVKIAQNKRHRDSCPDDSIDGAYRAMFIAMLHLDYLARNKNSRRIHAREAARRLVVAQKLIPEDSAHFPTLANLVGVTILSELRGILGASAPNNSRTITIDPDVVRLAGIQDSRGSNQDAYEIVMRYALRQFELARDLSSDWVLQVKYANNSLDICQIADRLEKLLPDCGAARAKLLNALGRSPFALPGALITLAESMGTPEMHGLNVRRDTLLGASLILGMPDELLTNPSLLCLFIDEESLGKIVAKRLGLTLTEALSRCGVAP